MPKKKEEVDMDEAVGFLEGCKEMWQYVGLTNNVHAIRYIAYINLLHEFPENKLDKTRSDGYVFLTLARHGYFDHGGEAGIRMICPKCGTKHHGTWDTKCNNRDCEFKDWKGKEFKP